MMPDNAAYFHAAYAAAVAAYAIYAVSIWRRRRSLERRGREAERGGAGR